MKIKRNLAVHCPTQQSAIEVLDLLKIKGESRKMYLYAWDKFEAGTCYDFNEGTAYVYERFFNKKFEIIEAEDFIRKANSLYNFQTPFNTYKYKFVPYKVKDGKCNIEKCKLFWDCCNNVSCKAEERIDGKSGYWDYTNEQKLKNYLKEHPGAIPLFFIFLIFAISIITAMIILFFK